MASACEKCSFFPVKRCKCEELRLTERIKELEATLQHIAEDGCAKCGTVAEQALKGQTIW